MNQYEFMGYLVAGLAGLSGLITVVVKMVNKQNDLRISQIESMTALNSTVQNLQGWMDKHEENNRKSHDKIFSMIEKQDDKMNGIEKRIREHDTDIALLKSKKGGE